MLKHHDADMDRFMDQLYLEGAVAFPWYKLYLMFNAARLGKNAYREIQRRWEELCTITFGYSIAPKLTYKTTDTTLTIFREAFKEHEKEKIMPFESLT